MRGKRKACAARIREEERKPAVTDIRRKYGMKVGIEESKRCNITEARKKLKTVRKKVRKTRGIDKMRSFREKKRVKPFPFRWVRPVYKVAERGINS